MVNKFCKGTFIEMGILKIFLYSEFWFFSFNFILYIGNIFDLLLAKDYGFLYFYYLNNDLHSIHIHVKSFTLLIFIICTYRFFMRIVYGMFYVATYYTYICYVVLRVSKILLTSMNVNHFYVCWKKNLNICVFP